MNKASRVPRIVVAGAASNVGKTTITAGLIAALRHQGRAVQPFKCGPDYVDPSYHERAAGRPCRNLDTWMLDDVQLVDSFARACADADIAVVEGVMGLFDGVDWHDERGSTAQIAKLLGAPVLLVVDISGTARSAAAVVLGYQRFDPAVALRGVILNFAGSERHALGCGEAITRATGLPVLGWLPRELKLRIPERHLGLVPGGEQADASALIAQMGEAVGAGFDIGAITAMADAAAVLTDTAPATTDTAAALTEFIAAAPDTAPDATPDAAPDAAPEGGAGAIAAVGASSAHIGARPDIAVRSVMSMRPVIAVRPVTSMRPDIAVRSVMSMRPDIAVRPAMSIRPVIAVARDEAFCFYYPENLELLAEEGAAIEFFSPLRGEYPVGKVAGIYIGGGYPELHGPSLASNSALWSSLRELHAADVPMYAECGGFMILTEGLADGEGRTWPMAGLIPGIARMSGKLAALGYRHATATRANLLADSGESLRGHEFRYSHWVCAAGVADSTAAWKVTGTRHAAPGDSVGYAKGNLLASYLHVHFGQRLELARRFVRRLRR